ncbi:MAG: PilW family protein [Betaproteobacteria bacterium]|nr:PilW family protein [Betaproteobacteria bacterium]MBK9605489.1 PilW family protein [Betaproteobacteria bacterium]
MPCAIHGGTTGCRRICRGAGLVELMVGITLGLLVLAAMATLFANNSAARNEIERTSQQIENGRFALQLLRDDIHLAGYFHGFAANDRRAADVCVPRSGVALSAGALGWLTAPAQAPLPLHGYAAGATPARESCIADQKAGTDVLIVRSVDPGAVTVAVAAADSHVNDYFLQTSACANPAIDAADRPFVVASGGGGALPAFTLHQPDCVTPALLRRLVVRAYYVGRCSVCSGSGDGIPALRMVELAGPSATSAALVEGIDALRIEFALDADGDGAIDALRRCADDADPCSPDDWRQVIGVRIHLLARNLTPTPGHVDAKTYDMGLAGVLAAPNDRYRRHLYSALVIAHNLAGPRER